MTGWNKEEIEQAIKPWEMDLMRERAACLPPLSGVELRDMERTLSAPSWKVGTSMNTTTEDQFAGVPCEFVHTRRMCIDYENGAAFVREEGFPRYDRRRLLGYIVEKPWAAVWNDKVDKVTDVFFEDKVEESKLYSKENSAVSVTETVQFHPYMNEMTVEVVRELAPRANTKDARIEVKDKSGRTAIVPKAWLKVTPKEEYTYALLYALPSITGGTQYFPQVSEEYARSLMNGRGNLGKYALVRKPKGADDYAYRIVT